MKRAVIDSALNVVAVALPTAALQLLVFPMAAAGLDSNSYGLLTTVFALMNLVPGTLGLALCNIRLLYSSNYTEKSLSGDFPLLLRGVCLLAAIPITAILFFYGVHGFQNMIFAIATSFVWLMREYFGVAFRIRLDFKSILFCNIGLAAGYVLGYASFSVSGCWSIILFTGQLISLVLILSQTDLWKEPAIKTELYSKVRADVAQFSAAAFLSRCISYSDRVLLFPMIGGHLVSVYYVSTLIGKMLSMIITPLNTVLLSYISRGRSKPVKLFVSLLLSGLALSLVGFIVVLLVAKPVLKILYPQFVEEAMIYLPVSSAAALIYSVSTVVNSFLVRFYDMSWQTRINAVLLVVYVLSAYSGYLIAGLLGFCIGYFSVNVLQLLIIVCVFFFKPIDSKTLSNRNTSESNIEENH